MTDDATRTDDSASVGGAGPTAVCDLCGTSEGDQVLGWTTSVERGRTRRYCERCSRENLRSIEGRLDSDWFG